MADSPTDLSPLSGRMGETRPSRLARATPPRQCSSRRWWSTAPSCSSSAA